jgi:hypothetical protein
MSGTGLEVGGWIYGSWSVDRWNIRKGIGLSTT